MQLAREPLLGFDHPQWAALNLFDTGVTLHLTLEALRVNHDMPRHTFDLLCELTGRKLKGRRVLVCGVSYLPDLADTRSSPTELLREELIRAGAAVVLHDPQVACWPEHPDVPVLSDLRRALAAGASRPSACRRVCGTA